MQLPVTTTPLRWRLGVELVRLSLVCGGLLLLLNAPASPELRSTATAVDSERTLAPSATGVLPGDGAAAQVPGRTPAVRAALWTSDDASDADNDDDDDGDGDGDSVAAETPLSPTAANDVRTYERVDRQISRFVSPDLDSHSLRAPPQ